MVYKEEKFKTLKELIPLVQRLKGEGKKIVLANGCFDLFHVGHIRYLKGAKEMGDILIVAINNDSSTRSLKGNGRPLMPEDERVEIVSCFSFVDYVTLFSEANVEKILLSLKPHIHAKGTDYTLETVPERDVAVSYGGRIAITGDKKNHSSTELIKKIKALKG
jgi:rfaE bifunctional protein nucleotidyltransferase chain/domain